jgi:predicted NUDIX family phosphoesterase
MVTGEEMFLQRDLVECKDYRIGEHRVRQVIPYVVVLSGGKVGLFRRIKGDKRLIDGYTIGIGGHIEPIDLYGKRYDVLFSAAVREIEEEVGASSVKSITMTNVMIESDATEVDSVHLGIVFVAELNSQPVCIDEELEWNGWKTFSELDLYELESWSKIIRKDLEKWISIK